jgi:hypothetical protein
MTQTISNQKIEYFFSVYGKWLLTAMLGSALLIFVIYRFMAPSHANNIKNYIDVKLNKEKVYVKTDDSDNSLNAIIASPFAEDNEAFIAQSLTLQNKWQEAFPWINKIQGKFLPNDSVYYKFSEISILIEQNKMDKVFNDSIALHHSIKNLPSHAFIESFNILRLKMLKSFFDENQIMQIDSLYQTLKSDTSKQDHINKIEDLFKEGNLTLDYYLKSFW